MTAVKIWSGYGLPRLRKVGAPLDRAAWVAEATKPHTVVLSPTWLAASSGPRGAAQAATGQTRSTTVDVMNCFDVRMAESHFDSSRDFRSGRPDAPESFSVVSVGYMNRIVGVRGPSRGLSTVRAPLATKAPSGRPPLSQYP